MAGNKNLYFAMDLGTTNSVMAYGNLNNQGNMKPIVIDIDRKSVNGSRSRDKVLPSVVFYYKNSEGRLVPEVGDYAKSRYGTKQGFVCKSVKSMMGVRNDVPLVTEIEDQTPAAVSAQIIRHMLQSAKTRLFQSEIDDMVITVPASFDSDQCQATLEAARLAGLNIDNEHDILLYEPKAVIYDVLQMQENGEIPADMLDVSTPKTVLVYDIGGGTLDVTIHKVGYNDNGVLSIEDIAISRYTQIGGDNFDELLASAMLKRFEEQNDITINIKRKEEVMCKLRRLAEQLKIEMSNAYESSKGMGIELADDYYEEVMEINLYDSYSYTDEFTKAELEDIIAPLLGNSYKIEDAKRIGKMTERDMNHIIYPILDVLAKAGDSCKIDTVILNGGMTKLYNIRERIEKFFGFPALTTSDPDLAVARGAVYYHYCLHKYNIKKSSWDTDKASVEKSVFYTGTIMNDAVNIGLRNEYVSRLIEAGTKLPYISEEISGKYEIGRATDTLGLEIFLGRGTTKNLPNRRIARRVIHFRNSYPAGTPVSFRFMIDQLRVITIEAWITGRPGEKAVIEVDTNSQKTPFEEKRKEGLNMTGNFPLNAKSELNEIKMLYERNKDRKKKDEINRRINECIENIGKASNPQDFFEPLMEMAGGCYQNDLLLAYLYGISMKLQAGWKPEQRRRMLAFCSGHFSEQNKVFVNQAVYVLRKAVDLIAVLDDNFLDRYEHFMSIGTVPEAIRHGLYENALLYGKDDVRVLSFIGGCTGSQLSPQAIQAFVKRFGTESGKLLSGRN